MSYLIRRKEPVDAEVRRILVEQTRRALALLAAWEDNPRDNVHQARQAFKRIRALLRLIRPAARYVFRVENAVFRDLGRDLAYARDTEAVIEALGLLEPRLGGPLALDSLHMLRVGLEQRAARERDCGLHDLAGRIKAACGTLREAGKRFEDIPLGGLRRRDLRKGVDATMERCRADYERVCHTRAAEDFHALRKDVKCAYHQTRLMGHSMARWANQAGPALGALGDELGHFHDLVILGALLGRQPDELNLDAHLRSMRNAVKAASNEFASRSLEAGARLLAPVAAPGNVVRIRARA